MKTMKKVLSLLMVAAMLMSMLCVAAFADDNNYTITINENKKAATSYEAYQIFAGTLSADGVLSDITWGTGVDSTKIEALQTALGVSSAKEAAERLDTNYTGTDKIGAEDFAKTVAEYLSNTYIENNGSTILVPKTAPGYYLIKNKDGSAEEGQAYTKFVMQVVGDCSFTPKTDAPEIEKKVKNHDELVAAYRDSNNVAIGDTIDYQITSAVPDMSKYSQYYFIMEDTLSEGLTYTDNMVVKVGETVLTETTSDDATDASYKLVKTTNDDGSTTLQIIFSNFLQYKDQTGAAVVVTYTAQVNDNALIGDTGNPNEVQLIYSNNPNKTGTGKNIPGDDTVVGKTPKDYNITYVTNIGIYKYDGSTKKALSGVTFTMSGLKDNDVTKIAETYVEDSNGDYYKLKDGSYTTTAPNQYTTKYYDSTETKYAITTTVSNFTKSTDEYTSTVTTDANGYAKFDSIAAGTYEIVEISTLDGYNMLENPIKITVTVDTPETVTDKTQTATWHITATSGDETLTFDKNGDLNIENLLNIANNKGSSLPSTGGMGTTLFYVFGAILVLGAGIVLVSRKRMANN